MSLSRATMLLALVFVLVLAPFATASAQTGGLDLTKLPPGIAKKVEPLLAQLMQHHQNMEMPECSGEMHEQHMGHLQALIDTLPPGILVQVLEVLVELPMPSMMAFHQEMQSGLLNLPPGQILAFVKGLAS